MFELLRVGPINYYGIYIPNLTTNYSVYVFVCVSY